MALLSTTLIIMFGMVVSVGHLIQAKMNLQNAVDLAAMSGASWQARYLNHIALINYRMRQNYKFVLYDLYVTQSRFNQGLKNELSTISGAFDRVPDLRAGSRQLVFGICQQAYGYDPASGVGAPHATRGEPGRGVAADTDMCQRASGSGGRGLTIPPIVPSPIPNLNPAVIAANLAIIALRNQAQEVCRDSGGQNSWYFEYIMRHLENRQRFQMEQIVELITLFRDAFGTEGQALSESQRVADQTIFRTFNENLISANRSGDFDLQYLNPPESRSFFVPGSKDSILQSILTGPALPQELAAYFERLSVRFEIPIVDFRVGGGGGCEVVIETKRFNGTDPAGGPLSNGPGVLLGLTRSRTGSEPFTVQRPLMVALRASVKPRLLFWPRGLTPTLVAVGVAKPFGSRLAPPTLLNNLEVLGEPIPGEQRLAGLANMSFYPGDYYIPGSGFMPGIGHKSVVDTLRNLLPNAAGGYRRERPSLERPGRSPESNCRDVTSFLCMAMFPTLYEGFFWNAFPFPSFNAFNDKIDGFFPSDHRDITQSLTPQRANVARVLYFMPDRMSSEIRDSSLLWWHQTALFNPGAGNSLGFDRLVSNSRPVFFASTSSVLSSWSPDIRRTSAFAGAEPLRTEVRSTDLRGRLGYQIKLVSVEQMCTELSQSGVAVPASLQNYCSGGGQEVLFQ
jgi:hypothetical protein